MKKASVFLTLGLIALLFLGTAPRVGAQGHFELTGHYGRWNLTLLGNILEGVIEDAAEDEIRSALLEAMQDDHPGIQDQGYRQTFDFRSSGDNYGFGVRWYPGGHDGSFSLGLSVEKSTFKIQPTASFEMDLYDGAIDQNASFAGTGSVDALIKTLSFHLTFRWDILPRSVVHPYLTIGGGISTAKALDDSVLEYEYSGQLTAAGFYQEDYGDSDTKTLREIKDESETDLPNFIPIVELALGLKAKISRSIHLMGEAGIFNGFLIRGGLAIRI
jgi:hypothetical protein